MGDHLLKAKVSDFHGDLAKALEQSACVDIRLFPHLSSMPVADYG